MGYKKADECQVFFVKVGVSPKYSVHLLVMPAHHKKKNNPVKYVKSVDSENEDSGIKKNSRLIT